MERKIDAFAHITGTTAKCVMRGCHTKFGIINPDNYSITFEPGWKKGDDGVWALTKYALKRAKRGKQPKFRRGVPTHFPSQPPTYQAEEAKQLRDTLSREDYDTYKAAHRPGGILDAPDHEMSVSLWQPGEPKELADGAYRIQPGLISRDEPYTVVKCWKCGFVQAIDPRRLVSPR